MAKVVETPTMSLNLRPCCNLLYPYTDVMKIDKESLLNDIQYWGEILVEIDSIMSKFTKPNVVVPDNVEVITKCSKCGSSNLEYSTGVAKATGKTWHAFDCKDCTSERNGNIYPTRMFVNLKQTKTSPLPTVEDDDEVPF